MSATVILNNGTCSGEYDMFDLRSLEGLDGDEPGAVLSGPLFLEVGETLTLRVQKGDSKVEVLARVHAIAPEDELMIVRFVDLDPASKAKLAK